jgi:hypothetical protein
MWSVDRKEQWRVEEIRADPSRRWCGCTVSMSVAARRFDENIRLSSDVANPLSKSQH